ncbi:FAD-dependent monooxygenase [Methyloligella sp. 2.7D]|uniref:FAD-dependent monooxygenase n=1 Tax=unclassified Methyloligella TaxID=2625955 RepID=UPI00157E1440|nr:FAD-dependent monooxygenase [Methyloligella sp. GL2]QKP77658.1 FAD-dependent monooxygenase [Methyloligella sp. GL2]
MTNFGNSNAMGYDAAIIGAGPSGLAAALALAHIAEGTGRRFCLIGPPPLPGSAQARDTRTAALMDSSIALLRQLGVWEMLAAHAAPLKAIRIVDGATAEGHTPEILFKASEIGLGAFGYNIPNAILVQALYERLQGRMQGRMEVIPVPAEAVRLSESEAEIRLNDGRTLRAQLVVGADGRRSVSRSAAGIPVQEWRYPQAAIAASFAHERPHENVSTEFHRRQGPLTTVPLPDQQRSSLVWVTDEAETEELMGLDDVGFAARLQSHLSNITGAIGAIGARASFPVAGLTAKELIGERTALVGEAAHILPPIGAQGLNLGFRDAAWLAEQLKSAVAEGSDLGARGPLLRYADSRKIDVMTRTAGVDLLNRSLLTEFPPAQLARGAVLLGLKAFPALRRLAMRAGISPPPPLPPLMRQAS